MDPIFKFPASPGTPLFPVSPERANRQHLPALPLSPSLPSNLSNFHDDPFSMHSRNTSDVQGKVAQFNNLSKEAVQRRKDNEAALKRAVVGREEAETETRRLREEYSTLQKEIEEGKGRERRVGERLEGVMEELHRTKETHSHSQALYEKEVRRARKEAFKSSSALVKLQEELKSTRNALSALRENTELQRAKVETREQEAFAAQYQLVGLQEELEKMRQQIKLVEDERDTLKSDLKEEEVARLAAEDRIVLPVSRDGDEFASPRKIKGRESEKRRESVKENLDPFVDEEDQDEEDPYEEEHWEPPNEELPFEELPYWDSYRNPYGYDEITLLKDELKRERAVRADVEGTIRFMNIECQFQNCSCRIAERRGEVYIYDASLAAKMERILAEKAEALKEMEPPTETLPSTTELSNTPTRSTTPVATTEPLIEFSPSTGTFHAVASTPKHPQQSEHPCEPIRQVSEDATAGPAQVDTSDSTPAPLPEDSPLLSLLHTPHHQLASIPSTPRPHVFNSPPSSTPAPTFSIPAQLQRPCTTRVISTTTTVPLADIFSPSMSREEALEQIRQRRGRARSVAAGTLTPRRQMVEGAGIRRDISAPVGRL